MTELQGQITVMQAFAAGKQITVRPRWNHEGKRDITEPTWNWADFIYEVKKEKKTFWGLVVPNSLPAAPPHAAAHAAFNWFSSEKELLDYYKTANQRYQVVSVEIEV